MQSDKTPLVSIVIPTFNYGHFLCQAIDSALGQSYLNTEIIVVDDGSSDNTSDIVKRYRDSIRYVYQKNQGLSAARNTGIRAARGQYVALLDADDVWLPEKLSEQIALFLSRSDLGAVSCFFYEVDEDLDVVSDGSYAGCDPEAISNDLLLANCFGGGSQIVVLKECFDTIGLFDEDLRSAEDWDMWLRISKKYHLQILNKFLLKVRSGSYNMSGTGNAQKMLNYEKAVLRKHLVGRPFMHARALGARYLSASWAFNECRMKSKALSCILLPFCVYPLNFFNKRYLGALVRIVSRLGG